MKIKHRFTCLKNVSKMTYMKTANPALISHTESPIAFVLYFLMSLIPL
jgi:hypothetical protein